MVHPNYIRITKLAFPIILANASVPLLALLVFIGAALALAPVYGNAGLWIAFIGYVIARAVALAYYYPRIIRAF